MAIVRSIATERAPPAIKAVVPKVGIADAIVSEGKASEEQLLAESTTPRSGGSDSRFGVRMPDYSGKSSASNGSAQAEPSLADLPSATAQ
jgi:hypothetical protein